MKYLVRHITVCAILVSLVCATKITANAQTPDPQFNSAFDNVPKPDPASLDRTYEGYMKVRNENAEKNKELAADAVLRAALFVYSGLKDLPIVHGPLVADDAQESWLNEAQKAHDALRKLGDGTDFPGTRAALLVNQPLWQSTSGNNRSVKMVTLREAMESQILFWNSRLSGWKGMGYRIIDALVKMTGAIPWFSYWFALALIAIVVKALTFPLMLRTYKSQREMQKVAPFVKELQEKYKGKPELNEKMMALYKEHKINPFASCLPMLIQIPFLIGVYQAIRLYEYNFALGKFLWIGTGLSTHYPLYLASNLAAFDLPLLLIYAASNYLTMRLTPQPDPAQAQQQKTMSVMMTGMMIFFLYTSRWSAAFIFYWLVMNFISAAQSYYYVYKPNKAKLIAAGAGISGSSGTVAGNGRIAPGSGNQSASSARSALTTASPATNLPGGESMRPRPKRRGKR